MPRASDDDEIAIEQICACEARTHFGKLDRVASVTPSEG